MRSNRFIRVLLLIFVVWVFSVGSEAATINRNQLYQNTMSKIEERSEIQHTTPEAADLEQSDLPGTFGEKSLYEQMQRIGKSQTIPRETPPEEGNAGIEHAGKEDVLEASELDLSRTERLLSGHFPMEISRDLVQFGYDFFDGDVSTFAPAMGTPVGDDYVVGPGDGFVVHLWGNVEDTQAVTVSRDGRITLPRLGTMDVSGMTYAELKAFLSGRFAQFYPDFQLSVSMEHLRSVEVFIVGAVDTPGTYSVSSLATIVTGLYAAGGPSKDGSLRNIQLLRNGRLVESLDLYDFLVNGLKQGDKRLEPGDTIFVPILGPTVGIAGNVKRPAIYEIKGKTTLRDVIELAGGATTIGQLQNVVIERIVQNRKRVIRELNIDPTFSGKDQNLDLPIADGDVIKIYPINDQMGQVVYLEGHVKYPMEYELKPGMRVRDLISSYDDLLPEAYLKRAEIVRLVPPDMHPEIVSFDPEKMLAGEDAQNLPLQDKDRVIVYASEEKKDQPEAVIRGEVRSEGTYPVYPGMTVRDLIFAAGNLTHKAFQGRAQLSRVTTTPDGAMVEKLEFSVEKAMVGYNDDNLVLRADDEVYIHQIPNYDEARLQKVTLEGEFLFPGRYSFSSGERLSSVIARAGGLTEHAYLYSAVFSREDVKKTQRAQIEKYVSQLEEDILASESYGAELLSENQAASFTQSMALKRQLLEEIRNAEPTGRVVIDLEKITAAPSSVYDMELKAGDHLAVGRRSDHVNVLGEVVNATSIFWEPDRSISYYLDRVGGLSEKADKRRIYVIQATGMVIGKNRSGFLRSAGWLVKGNRRGIDRFGSLKLNPGDTIIVPPKTDKYRGWNLAKDVVDVAYKIAIAAGVIIVAY